MYFYRRPIGLLTGVILLFLYLTTNVNTRSVSHLIRTSKYPWEDSLTKWSRTTTSKKVRHEYYGVFVKEGTDPTEAAAFRNSLEEILDDRSNGPGRYSYTSINPFGNKPRIDFIFAKIDPEMAKALEKIRIIHFVLITAHDSGSITYLDDSPIQHLPKEGNPRNEAKMLNQAPGQQLSEATADPHSSNGKGIVSRTRAYEDLYVLKC